MYNKICNYTLLHVHQDIYHSYTINSVLTTILLLWVDYVIYDLVVIYCLCTKCYLENNIFPGEDSNLERHGTSNTCKRGYLGVIKKYLDILWCLTLFLQIKKSIRDCYNSRTDIVALYGSIRKKKRGCVLRQPDNGNQQSQYQKVKQIHGGDILCSIR